MSCGTRTSDLDLSDFKASVLSSTSSCQSNRTHDGLKGMLRRREGASPLYGRRGGGMSVTETGGRKALPEALKIPG